MLISIIIPTFERQLSTEQAIYSAIKSINKLNTEDYEIIIVDDCSEIPFTFNNPKYESQIKILRHEKNKGPAASRNTGIKHSKGKWLAFLDSDDIWLSNKLVNQFRFIENNKIKELDNVAITCGVIMKHLYSQRKSEIRIPIEASDLSIFASGCWHSPGSSLLISRKIFLEVGYFNENLRRLEDYEWFLRFANKSGQLLSDNQPLVLVRIARSKIVRNVIEAIKEIKNNLSIYKTDKFIERIINSYLYLEWGATSFIEKRYL